MKIGILKDKKNEVTGIRKPIRKQLEEKNKRRLQ